MSWVIQHEGEKKSFFANLIKNEFGVTDKTAKEYLTKLEFADKIYFRESKVYANDAAKRAFHNAVLYAFPEYEKDDLLKIRGELNKLLPFLEKYTKELDSAIREIQEKKGTKLSKEGIVDKILKEIWARYKEKHIKITLYNTQ